MIFLIIVLVLLALIVLARFAPLLMARRIEADAFKARQTLEDLRQQTVRTMTEAAREAGGFTDRP